MQDLEHRMQTLETTEDWGPDLSWVGTSRPHFPWKEPEERQKFAASPPLRSNSTFFGIPDFPARHLSFSLKCSQGTLFAFIKVLITLFYDPFTSLSPPAWASGTGDQVWQEILTEWMSDQMNGKIDLFLLVLLCLLLKWQGVRHKKAQTPKQTDSYLHLAGPNSKRFPSHSGNDRVIRSPVTFFTR